MKHDIATLFCLHATTKNTGKLYDTIIEYLDKYEQALRLQFMQEITDSNRVIVDVQESEEFREFPNLED